MGVAGPDFYRRMLDEYITSSAANNQGEWRGYCPIHEDPELSSSPSATFNFLKGVWHCNSGTCGGGGLEMLVPIVKENKKPKRKKDDDDWSPFDDVPDNVRSIEDARAKRNHVEPIGKPKIDGYVSALQSEKERLQYLKDRRGLTDESIVKYGIGWDRTRGRFTIPIYDEGALVNIRRYDPDAEGPDKMKNANGHGSPARLFPMESMAGDEIVVCEGEWDALVNIQNGFNTVTNTHGVSTWRSEWNKLFTGKKVYLTFDCDKAGRVNSKKVARQLLPHAESVHIVNLGLSEGEDLTDWYVQGHTAAELRELLGTTPAVSAAAPQAQVAQEPLNVQLRDTEDAKLSRTPMSVQVTVIGKKGPAYHIPKVARMECTMDAGPKCKACPMFTEYEGQRRIQVEPTDIRTVSQLIDVKDSARLEVLRQHLGAVKCNRLTYETEEEQTVEELFVSGSIDRGNSNDETDYTQRRVYNIGSHETDTNIAANIVGTTIPSPKDQRNEFFSWGITEASTSIDKFEMTPEKYDALKVFQPREGQTPLDKMREIANDLSANVTYIVGRERLHMAMDLVWHSALHFRLDDKPISRGWLEFIVVGDTRTGKSETSHRLADHYRLGTVIGCEGASFAGLVGGVTQIRNEWTLKWGEVTLNDRRLCVLDEASGLSQDIIGSMSDIRSRGVAQIMKIVSHETRARVRLIWISNPRVNKSGERYYDGVWLLEDLIGNPEDIARFDFAMSVSSGDVPSSKINTMDRPVVEHVYTSDLCHELILWAWSRRADQVQWKPEAYKLVYDKATVIGEKYVDQPPLVQSGNIREKIARISVAMAARTFSTDNGENIVVLEEHVEGACDFLDQLYSYDNFGYLRVSQRVVRNRKIARSNKVRTRKFLTSHPRLLEFLIDRKDSFRSRDLEELLGFVREEVNVVLGTLSDYKMIAKHKSQIVIEPELMKLLKEMERR